MMCPNCLERIVITTTYYEIIVHEGALLGEHQKICSWQCMIGWFAE